MNHFTWGAKTYGENEFQLFIHNRNDDFKKLDRIYCFGSMGERLSFLQVHHAIGCFSSGSSS